MKHNNKNTKTAKSILSFVLISILALSCQNYVPENHVGLSKEKYEIFRNKLLKAYKEKNNYLIAFQLANLKAPNELIFKHLKKAVNETPNCCNSIFKMKNLARQGFFQTLYKTDTIQFREIFNLCLQKLGDNAYNKYEEQYFEDTKIHIKSRPKLDSSLMNYNLITELKKINDNDQVYRKRLADFRISGSERENLLKLQLRLDSINLFKTDSILLHHGYPNVQEVGYDLLNTLFLVVHHQSNPQIREKYFIELEGYLSEGQKKLFNKRTLFLIKLNK